MPMILFLLSIFLGALFLSLLLTPCVRDLATTIGVVASPSSKRHLHTEAVPRLGGVAVFMAFSLALVLALPLSRFAHINLPVAPFLAILLPATIIFLLGVYDDLRPVTPKIKIAVQLVAATALYFGGFGIRFSGSFLGIPFLVPAVGLVITVFWVLLITNAFNLIDGVDGLAAGSAVISAMILVAAAFFGHSYISVFLMTALAGAIAGFLPSNFYPASIFMGDSGSLFIGFLLSASACAGFKSRSTFTSAAIPILIFALPILDVALALVRRTIRGQSPFHPDADHIHHQLLKRGCSQSQVAVLLYGVTALFGVAGLLLAAYPSRIVVAGVGVAVALVLGVRQLGYPEFSTVPSHWISGAPTQATSQSLALTADRARILVATKSLNDSGDFRAVCSVLHSLKPVGFDGLRLKTPGDRLPPSLLFPMQYDSEGHFSFMWSTGRLPDSQAGRLMEELVLSSHPNVGRLSLLHQGSAGNSHREKRHDLSEDFTAALSDAILRAVNRAKLMRRSVPGNALWRSAAIDTPRNGPGTLS